MTHLSSRGPPQLCILYSIPNMATVYDVFVSHAWADGDLPHQIAQRLTKAGLRVWFDADEITDFAGITRSVTEGLAQSKALVAYYSKTYPLRRACQWELTAAFLAAQCEGDPRRRVLVINPERNAGHIHPIELHDAKFLAASTDEGSVLDAVVKSIAKQAASLKGPLAHINPLTPPNWYGIKPAGSTHFVGRLAEMWEVHSLLHRGDVTQITGAPAATGGIGQVSGLGGVGKTLLAEEYALHFGAAYPGGIFWLRAYGNDNAKGSLGPNEREALRTDQIHGFAQDLGIKVQGLSAKDVEAGMRGEIERRGQASLWVVDDVPNGLNGEALRQWFAPHPLARTLITTRSREYGSLSKGIDLGVLAPDEANQLLTSRKQPDSEAEEEQARKLAKDLGYHSLALDVTASALVSSVAARPFADFRTKLARPDKDALVLAETLADALPNDHDKSISQTILGSIRGLGMEGLDFVRLASVLAAAPIPASLVIATFEQADNISLEKAEERASLAFQQVTASSLAWIPGKSQESRSVHALVSRTVRFQEKYAPARTEALRIAAVEALTTGIAERAADPRRDKQIELHVAHAQYLVATPATETEADLLGWVGRYYYIRGSYEPAKTLFERQLEFRRNVLGPEHPDTLKSMNELALIHSSQGNLDYARNLQHETLAIVRRVQGPEHTHTLSLMSNLGGTLYEMGDFVGARKLIEEVLSISRRILGNEHPNTIGSMANLAETMSSLGDLAGACKLQEEVVAFFQRVLGPDHLNTLTSMHNLANTLCEQGDLAKAGKLYVKVLAIRRRVLGRQHSDTLLSMSSLAATLQKGGSFAKARRLQQEALSIQRRVLGIKHSHTSISAWRLCVTLQALSEGATMWDVLQRDLRWLLDYAPSTLSSAQRKIREYVDGEVKKMRSVSDD